MKHLFASSILAATLTLLSVPSYGQTTINSVPYTISSPGTYVLTSNLTCPGGYDAITVNVSNVTIDLNGYYLYCPTPTATGTGIFVNDRANVRIKNGEIVGFYVGVYAEYASSVTNLNFGHLIEDVRFYNNSTAVEFYQSSGCVVKDCQIIGGANGHNAVWFDSGTGNRAVGNVASGLTLYGFYSNGSDYFDSNYADSCTYGIYATSTTTKLRFNTTTNCNRGISGGSSELTNDR
jgi:hypothetical protein